jgi:hypothetical protein
MKTCKACEKDLEKCSCMEKGMSFRDLQKKELGKARVDEGKAPKEKQAAREDRNFRFKQGKKTIGIDRDNFKDWEQRGVHRPSINVMGESYTGERHRLGDRKATAEEHHEVLGEIRSMKPNLPKSELAMKKGQSYNDLRNEYEIQKSLRPIRPIKPPQPPKAKSAQHALPGKSDQMKKSEELASRARGVLAAIRSPKK